jgi:hypothetical protein
MIKLEGFFRGAQVVSEVMWMDLPQLQPSNPQVSP